MPWLPLSLHWHTGFIQAGFTLLSGFQTHLIAALFQIFLVPCKGLPVALSKLAICDRCLDWFLFLIRLDKLKVEECGPQESNHVENHRSQLTEPEIQNNERNREVDRDHTEEERKRRDAERYGFQKDGGERERPLTKINSVKLQPAQAAAVKNNITSAQVSTETDGSRRSPQVNGSGEQSPANGTGGPPQRTPTHEADRNLSRTSSMHQLEQWVRTQRGRGQDEDNRRSVGWWWSAFNLRWSGYRPDMIVSDVLSGSCGAGWS